MKKTLKILIIVLSIFLLSSCSLKKKTTGKLILATEAGFAPYEYYEDGKVVGVDIDIAKEIAKELNKELVIKDVAFDSIINEVKTGKSDIGAAGISYTKERALEVDFTENYAVSKQVIVVKDKNIKSIDDITGKIAVQLGTTADLYLSDERPDIPLIREKKFLAAIEDLKSNKVEAVLMDELPAKKLVTDELFILEEPVITDQYGIIISKDNPKLLEDVNKVIKRLKEEGKIEDFTLNHLGVEGSTKRSKIYNTLIKDNRYKFIITGLKNTVVMAVCAVIIGIIIGTILALIRTYGDKTGKLVILNFLSRTYINVIRGTPSILQLLIIYYVIFRGTAVNIVLVGILSFGINSSAYVAEIIRAGINSVSKYQEEAGAALGLSYKDVMRYIIMPQAVKNILPALGNEFITLVKETAVGAYIGILDLTKASDIISSRTYDYFFPLTIIALIYLLITYTLSRLVSRMEKRLKDARD